MKLKPIMIKLEYLIRTSTIQVSSPLTLQPTNHPLARVMCTTKIQWLLLLMQISWTKKML